MALARVNVVRGEWLQRTIAESCAAATNVTTVAAFRLDLRQFLGGLRLAVCSRTGISPTSEGK